MKKLFVCMLAFCMVGFIFSPSLSAEERTRVLLKTDLGDVTIVLYNQTDYHRDNFIKLVNEGFYDGLLMHRIIDNFMIQAGDPDSKNASKEKRLGGGGPGYTIPAEILPEYFHKKGAVAAARTPDEYNPARRSSGSQFFIVTGKVFSEEELKSYEKQMSTKFLPEQKKIYTDQGGTPALDGQYSVFGEVVKGLDIVEKIGKVKTGKHDRPKKDIKIIKAEVIN
ncbi:MAG: peptidylprolyl isomerase [Thermodesulfobacteriota bacterium]